MLHGLDIKRVTATAGVWFWVLVFLTSVSAAAARADGYGNGKGMDGNATVEMGPYTSYYKDLILGDADAPLTVVEYVSYTCSHCRDFSREIFPQIREKYIGPGKVRFIIRSLIRNKVDLMATSLTSCVPQDQAFGLSLAILQRQQDWLDSEDVLAAVLAIAPQGQAWSEPVGKCVAKELRKTEIVQSSQQYNKDGIIGTPALFINYKMFEGYKSAETVTAAIQEELNALGSR